MQPHRNGSVSSTVSFYVFDMNLPSTAPDYFKLQFSSGYNLPIHPHSSLGPSPYSPSPFVCCARELGHGGGGGMAKLASMRCFSATRILHLPLSSIFSVIVAVQNLGHSFSTALCARRPIAASLSSFDSCATTWSGAAPFPLLSF